MSIESFGAIVSDNDGSAFITKAEFESAKNEFSTEINRYETSIDAKLQGAISSYLEGVRIQVKPTLYFDRLMGALGGGHNPFFLNSATAGTTTLTSGLAVVKSKKYSTKFIKKITNTTAIVPVTAVLKWTWSMSGRNEQWFNLYRSLDTGETDYSGGKGVTSLQTSLLMLRGSSYFIDVPGWSNSKIRYKAWYGNDDTKIPTAWTEAGPSGIIDLGEQGAAASSTNNYNIAIDCSRLPEGMSFMYASEDAGNTNYKKFSGIGGRTLHAYAVKPDDIITTTTTTLTLNNPVVANSTRSGSGARWTYIVNPDGTKQLNNYWSTFYPQQNITLNYKTYKDYGTKTSAITANELKDDNACTFSPSYTPTYGIVTVGTNHTSYNTTNKVGYMQAIYSLTKSLTDNNDYRIAQWGNNTNTNIYANSEQPTLTKTSTNLASSYTNLAASNVTIEGVTHTTTAVTNNYYDVTINPETLKLNTFVNSYYTGIAGETVKIGYGIPIMMTNADDSARYTITIPVKQTVAPAGTTVASGNVTARLSLNHFVDGAFATAADKVWEGTITCNSSGVGSVTFTVDGIPRGKQLWLNLYGTTNARKVELTGFNVNMS